MINLNPNEKEKIYNRISDIKEEIWEARSYISSDICLRCGEMYSKIAVLEQELKILQRKLEKDERA